MTHALAAKVASPASIGYIAQNIINDDIDVSGGQRLFLLQGGSASLMD